MSAEFNFSTPTTLTLLVSYSGNFASQNGCRSVNPESSNYPDRFYRVLQQ